MITPHFRNEPLERRHLLSAGDLDPTFGLSGVADLGTSQPPEYQSVVAEQPDGKLVTAGHREDLSHGEGEVIVRRWLTNGAIDTSFGTQGTVRLPKLYFAGGIKIVSQNKILIAGTSKEGLASAGLVRLNLDGSLDTSFGGDGMVSRSNIEALDNVRGLEIQTDGQLVVLVQSEDGGSILRFNSDGSVDNSFSDDGLSRIKINSDFAAFTSITLDAQNNIYAVGGSSVFTPNASLSSSLIARVTATGDLDTTLDGDGLWFGSINSNGSSVLLLADGSLLLTGVAFPQTTTKVDMSVQRLSAVGQVLDTASLSFDGFDLGQRAFETEGGYLIFGSSRRNNVEHIIVTKLDADLNKVAAFGENGSIDLNSGSLPRSTLKLSNGGFAITGDEGLLVKVTESAQLDDAFGVNGKTQPPTEGELGSFEKMLALSDGKYLAVGKTFSLVGGADYYLARFNHDGSYDRSFGGGNGFVALSLEGPSHTEGLSGLAVQSDGKIVVVGSVTGPNTHGYLVARFTKNGSLDNLFDGDGMRVFTQAGAGSAGAVTLTAFGKIVVAGTTGDQHTFVQQLTKEGAVDGTFGAQGMFVSSIQSGGKAMTIQKDGQIIVAGSTLGSGDTDLAAFRLSSGGMLNRTYTTDHFFDVKTVVALPNGTIVFAGSDGFSAYAEFFVQDGTLLNTQPFRLPLQGHISETVLDAAVDGQNRITFVGRSAIGFNRTPGMFVYRTLASGIADTSFNNYSHELVFSPTAAAFSNGQPIAAGTASDDVLHLSRLRGNSFDVSQIRVEGKDLIVVGGDAKNDTIDVKRTGSKIEVKMNGIKKSYNASSISHVYVIGNGGHDKITLNGSLPRPNVQGDAGNDSVVGSNSADYISGGAGFDTIKAGSGDDTVFGDADKDFIEGNAGDDLLTGGDGGDNIFGGTGDDTLFGAAGDDQLFGQAGFDRSDPGAYDVRNSIEQVIS